jgi:hypothetical protein
MRTMSVQSQQKKGETMPAKQELRIIRIIRSLVFSGVQVECLDCLTTTEYTGTRMTRQRRNALVRHGCAFCRNRDNPRRVASGG